MTSQSTKAKTYKLDSENAVACLRLLVANPNMTNEFFINKICASMKLLETWDNLMQRRYGPVAKQSLAYKRLLDRLKTYEGLQSVSVVMATGVPIHGASDANPGILDCRLLVAEFDRCKAGGLPPPSRVPTAAELETIAAEKAKEAKEKEEEAERVKREAAAAAKAAREDEELELMPLAPPRPSSEVVVDPAKDKAREREAIWDQRVAEDYKKVQFHEPPEALLAAWEQHAVQYARGTIFILCRTSGWGAISAYLDVVATILTKAASANERLAPKIRIMIMPGHRYDIMGHIVTRAGTLPALKDWSCFTSVLQRRDNQTLDCKPSFCITLIHTADVDTSGEKQMVKLPRPPFTTTRPQNLRSTCKDRNCKHRNAPMLLAADDTTMLSEIQPEDRDQKALADMQAELAQLTEGEGSGVSADPSAGQKPEDYAVELWPCGMLSSHCTLVQTELGLANQAQFTILLGPSAHPAPWVSARELGLDMFVLTRRQSLHALGHGQALGKALRREALAPSPLPDEAPSPAAYQCFNATVVGDSVLEAYDVAAGPLWREGLNRNPSGEAFVSAGARLVAEQLESLALGMSAAEAGTRHLTTKKPLTNGTTMPASALFFEPESALLNWLSLPGHDKYRASVVKLPGVRKNGDSVDAWAVRIGAIQYAGSYIGVRAAPNAFLRFTPSSGFNEGALELVISTRNNANVAKDAALFLDCGPDFNQNKFSPGSGFQGALDVAFASTAVANPDEKEEHERIKQDLAAEEAKEAEAEKKRKAEAELEAEHIKKTEGG